MKLALIPPFCLLDYTFETDYQLMLPQNVKNASYRDAYKRHGQNPDTYVILDNGMAEGKDIDFATIVEVAEEYQVNEIVMPDHLRNFEKTTSKVLRFRDQYRKAVSDFKMMYVIQGQSWKEFGEAIEFASHIDWIDTIGIPRHAVETLNDLQARLKLGVKCLEKAGEKEIHFLGASSRVPFELANLNAFFGSHEQVRGFDSSMPFNYAHAGERMLGGVHINRPRDYFRASYDSFDHIALEYNLQLMLTWTGYVD